jgi:hypothetical protein
MYPLITLHVHLISYIFFLGVIKGRVYEEMDLMRESRAEEDVIADIAAEELQAYLGRRLFLVPNLHTRWHT